jgi:hypothetical protein
VNFRSNRLFLRHSLCLQSAGLRRAREHCWGRVPRRAGGVMKDTDGVWTLALAVEDTAVVEGVTAARRSALYRT